MVQIRQKNKFQMSCMKSVEIFFFKVQRTTSPATLLKQTKKSIQNPQILITPPRPVAQKGNTFLFFHATGNPLVESTSNWSLFISNGVRFFW